MNLPFQNFILNNSQSYDYIIAGAGCAGLSLAVHMIRSGQFTGKKILIADRDHKSNNDRTWSFWEQTPGIFEPVVFRKWSKTWFHNEGFSKLLDLSPYEYKMIRGIDFYQYCFSVIRGQPGFEFLQGEIGPVQQEGNRALIRIGKDQYSADYIFSSLYKGRPDLGKKDHYLLQHFRGWVIETKDDVFNPDEATLMDFRTGQQKGTTFVYIKPFSKTKALVEYTLFTGELLESSQYDQGLQEYINRFITKNEYQIAEIENGIIPMTNYRFPAVEGRVIRLGTSGGQTKASSGYTFQFIQKHSEKLVQSLIKKGNPFIARPGGKWRFRFYDSVLLNILANKKWPGDRIFTDLFRKNNVTGVLKFLDNESSPAGELKIISSLPTLPFLKAALKQL